MRVVIIRSNPIRPDSRVEKEAYSLASNGHSVMILCWDRDSNHKVEVDTLQVANQQIPITRLGFKAEFGAGMKSIRPYMRFQLAMRHWLKKNRQSFDVVHACDFDTAFFSLPIAKRLKKKFVFDIFDYLSTNPKTWRRKQIKKAEDNIINKADATIICTEDRKIQINGTKPKKLVVIHNSPFRNQLPQKIERVNSEIPKICYVGILQEGRLLKEIGQFFYEHPEYQLEIGGFGKYDRFFSDLSEKCGNIKYYGRLPYEKTLEVEAGSDIMLAIYDPKVPNHVYAAPNKFYESLFLGKPVIMVKGTGMSSLVEENNIGCLMEYNIESFERAVVKLMGEKAEWQAMGRRGMQLYEKQFCWEIMEKRLVDLYEVL